MRSLIKPILILPLLATLRCSAPVDPPPRGPAAADSFIPADTAVRLGRLVNPADGRVMDHAVVLIKADRITYVGADASRIPPSARIVDWSSYTGLPGLVDAHTHIAFVTDGLAGVSPWARMSQLDDDTHLRIARAHALATLRVGVTTVIDKGSGTGIDKELKAEINASKTPGPRLFLAGPGMYKVPPHAPERTIGGIVAPSDIAAEIQREVDTGSDLIKMWADSCSDRDLQCSQRFTAEEIRIAVDEAHRLGRPIAIHAYHGSTARDVVAAGADAVDHPISLDQPTLREMARRGTVYVPTIDHNRYYKENAALFGTSPSEVDAFDAFIDQNVETVRAAHRAGVRIAMGSDALFTMFGENTRELGWLIKAGLTPLEALRAATVNGAASIHKENEIGAVAPGYLADIIAVEGDPLADINVVIKNVRAVMVGGKVLDPSVSSAPPAAPPASIAAPDVPSGADAARDAELKEQATAIQNSFSNSSAALLPGGKKVVFVSDRDGRPQLYLGDVSKPSARPERLFTMPEGASDPVVTPDGRSVLFRSIASGSGRLSLFRAGLDGHQVVELTPEGPMIPDAPFAPRGASPAIAVYSAKRPRDWRTSLFLQELAPGEAPRLVYVSELAGSAVDVSSDGKWALLVQHPSAASTTLVLVDLTSGAARTIYSGAGHQASIKAAAFTADGKRALVADGDGGERLVLVAIDIATGKELARRVEDRPAVDVGLVCAPRGDRGALLLTSGDHTEIQLLDTTTLARTRDVAVPVGIGTLRAGAFSDDGKRLSVTFSTFANPSDIFWADVDAGKLTPLREDIRPGLSGLARVDVSITDVRSFDGTRIPVNLYLPAAGAKGARKPAPVLVMFHRGPADAAATRWDGMRRFYAAQGYAIVEPNIRGSSGFGRAYELADDGRRRVDALKDAEVVARWTAVQPWADKDRMVAFGVDYGGYVALMELTRKPSLFRAGVSVIGTPSLRAQIESRLGRLSPRFAAEFGDLSKDGEFLDSISPLRDVNAIETPLFVYAVAADPQVPRSGTDQIVRALRERRIPVEYMVVSDEGHSFLRPGNHAEILARSARFLAKVLGPS
jgi:dipeptidyl aminopeptidase/acylaminoacyl peptidase